MHRWVVVADSGFVPARGGGDREHLGFLRVASEAGWVAALVIPTREPIDFNALAAVVGDTPVIPTDRRLSLLRLAHPRYPYVVASRPYPHGLAKRIQTVAPDATGIVTFSYKSHQIGENLAIALHLPMVVRHHNHEGTYHRSLAAGLRGPRRLVMSWEAWRIERDERKFDRSPTVTAIADISAEDAAARRATGARRVAHLPPFAFDINLAAEPLAVAVNRGEEPPRVLFLGALDIVTNQIALAWFTGDVWPRVREAVPDAVFSVVGSRPPAALGKKLTRIPNVELHADVTDLRPYLARSRVAVNPAVTGSGVNIKIIDYLQAGLPVVSTTLATRGISLRAGVDLEVDDDPVAFADAVVGLLRDADRAAQLARSGRARVAELLDPRRNLDRLADLFAEPNDPVSHSPDR